MTLSDGLGTALAVGPNALFTLKHQSRSLEIAALVVPSAAFVTAMVLLVVIKIIVVIALV